MFGSRPSDIDAGTSLGVCRASIDGHGSRTVSDGIGRCSRVSSSRSMELDGAAEFHLPAQDVHEKLAQPLLVDLHSDQSFVSDYLRRNEHLGSRWVHRLLRPLADRKAAAELAYTCNEMNLTRVRGDSGRRGSLHY